jgi:hypothetical protein
MILGVKCPRCIIGGLVFLSIALLSRASKHGWVKQCMQMHNPLRILVY